MKSILITGNITSVQTPIGLAIQYDGELIEVGSPTVVNEDDNHLPTSQEMNEISTILILMKDGRVRLTSEVKSTTGISQAYTRLRGLEIRGFVEQLGRVGRIMQWRITPKGRRQAGRYILSPTNAEYSDAPNLIRLQRRSR